MYNCRSQHCHIYCYGIVFILLIEIKNYTMCLFLILQLSMYKIFATVDCIPFNGLGLDAEFGLLHHTTGGRSIRTQINYETSLADIYFCHIKSFTCWNSFWYPSSEKDCHTLIIFFCNLFFLFSMNMFLRPNIVLFTLM